MLILHVVGARPNFMKLAPVRRALADLPGVDQVVIHTGQHYDEAMSQIFFDHLGLPAPDANLGVGSGSHARQTAQVMVALEEEILNRRPDLVMVYGDVNSTLAASLVCAKLGVAVAHVEAGLRSFDRAMPEEINRILTDRVADFLYTPSEDGDQHLLNEGVDPARIIRVGNVMIDTLVTLLPAARERWESLAAGLPAGAVAGAYALVTLHRPGNVDDPASLADLAAALKDIAARLSLVFPVHPRTRARLAQAGLNLEAPGLHLVDPLGYLDFLALEDRAAVAITDSGGVQEETTYLGVPCLTLRPNTERPVTVTLGTNQILGDDLDALKVEVDKVLEGKGKKGGLPPLWEGRAARRIAEHVATLA